MNDQPNFQSRRELREAERAGLVQREVLPFDGVPRVDKAEVPAEPTGVPLTRRQLRELEKTGGVLAIHTSQIQLPPLPNEPEAVVADEVLQPDAQATEHETWAPEPTDSVLAEREEPVTTVNPVIASEPRVDDVLPIEQQPPVELAGERKQQPEISRPEQRQTKFEYHPDFESLLRGEAETSAKTNKGKRRRTLIIVAAVLVAVVAGLAVAYFAGIL